MRARDGLTVALVLTLTAVGREASAHRTEDYLQAARIGIASDSARITLDVTPGMAVVEPFMAALDRDRDGALSAEEQREYARLVVGSLEVEIDERPLLLRLVSWSFPEPSAFRRGEGTVRLEIQTALPALPAGAHRLLFRNTHLAGHSAYLANVLVPESARVAVTSQRRDPDQSELLIEFVVNADSARARLAWVLGSLAAALVVMGSRWVKAV